MKDENDLEKNVTFMLASIVIGSLMFLIRDIIRYYC